MVLSPCCYSPIKIVIHCLLPTQHLQQYYPKNIHIRFPCELSSGKIIWIDITESAFNKCADISRWLIPWAYFG
ncbi:hypothetical protein HanPSC8_Chr09g0353091 [Helianthus annuus]|nr:hypothetical protein HanPSC8_Chr09g0353091 [Helianthus annuus]